MKKGIFLVIVLGLALLAAASVDAQQVMKCGSKGHDHQYCRVNTRGGVTLVHQRSHAGCWKGDTWGYDNNGIWVSNGCRADFRIGSKGNDWAYSLEHNYSRHHQDVNWHNDRDRDRWVDHQVDNVMGNHHKKKHHDEAAVAVGAVLAAGIIAAVAGSHDDHDKHQTNQNLVTCESKDGNHHYCSVGYLHTVEIKRQLSSSECNYNRTWGYDSHGIWVTEGCRAEFWINR